MNLSFDPTDADEAVAAFDALLANAHVRKHRAGFAPYKVVAVEGENKSPISPAVPVVNHTSQPAPVPVVITPQQADSMDDTGGIRSVPTPKAAAEAIITDLSAGPEHAPSTAAAPASHSAPEALQAGAAIDPSVFGQSAATAPVPAVPTAPAAPTSPAPAGDDPVLDKRGLPWDERIHASTKATNADGTWRARRNMTDDQKSAVPGIEAELLARVGRQNVAASDTAQRAGIVITGQSDVTAQSSDLVPAAPAVSAPPLPSQTRGQAEAALFGGLPAAPVPPPVPSLPAIPSSTPPAAAPAQAAATASGEPLVPAGDFVALFGKVTKLIVAQPGVFGDSDVEDICERLGLPRKGGMMQLPGICTTDAARGAQLVADFDAAVEEMFA